MVAEAKANLYPCFTNTMTWDTAAGHAILKAADGDVYLLDDKSSPLLYDKDNLSNPHFLAIGSIF
jgi:3'(2'), 5'-bisphosphate nucleotidase